MQHSDIGALLREAMVVVLKLGGPPLGVALAVGLVMSLAQAVTQINEQTLAFVPKVLAIGGALLLLGPYMQVTLTDFTHHILDQVISTGAP